MRIAQWMHRVTRLSVGVPLAWLVLLSSTPSGATDTRQQLSSSRTELEGLCTHKSLQAYAPAGLIIRDIPNVNPALSAAIKIAGGVAYQHGVVPSGRGPVRQSRARSDVCD